MHRALATVLAALALAAPGVVSAEPVVSIWYRGRTDARPHADDLALIRARGFSHVTWPSSSADGLPELRRLAALVGLQVVTAVAPDGQSLEAVIKRPGRLDLRVDRLDAGRLPAVVWPAVTDHVQAIAFDSGDLQGLARFASAPWVVVAARMARQIAANGSLFDELEPAGSVSFEEAQPEHVQVRLFDTARSWAILATNSGATPARAVTRLPRDVPYAVWVSLLDESTVGMLDQPGGATWTFDIAPGDAKFYVIDKIK